jgi:signal transduction histidine kinase
MVSGRPRQILIILLNLIRNATEAMASQSTETPRRITFEVAHGARWTDVIVGDTGPGLDASSMEKIFAPSFTTKGAAGTGLIEK